MNDVFFYEGSNFFLRELRAEDLNGNWYKWLNDGEVTAYQDKKITPQTLEKQREYYNKLQTSKTDVVLAIIEKQSLKHIGNVGLHSIDWVHRSAQFGIIIGEKEYWGRGIGAACWKYMVQYGFETLNLHRIYALVADGNPSSKSCAEKAGFLCEGKIRQFFYKNGKYLDVFYFNILISDFIKNNDNK